MAEWIDNKEPLNSPEAEREVLAYLYYFPDAQLRNLQPDYFYTPKYRKIYEAIVNIKADGKTPDLVQLCTYFDGQPQNDKNGIENPTKQDILALGDITQSIADATLSQNVALLKDYALRRQSKALGIKIATAATTPSMNMEEALKEVSELIDQREAETTRANLLTLPTLESLNERDAEIREMGKGDLKTSYYFQSKDGKNLEQFTLPSGAITLVCALTSHGKSTFLRDIALEIAQNEQQGDTLFYTYESSEQEIEWSFINSYLKEQFNRKGNNFETIKDYEQTGKNFFAGDNLQKYLKGKEQFRKELLCSGKLRLLRANDDATERQDEIRFYNKRRPIKAVFIDYIQKLHLKGNKLSRTEELSKICSSFEALAIELGIPIVMGAQLNRQTTDPVTMCSQNLAESTAIEQSSAKMVFLWNSTERARVDKESKELKDFADRTGITLGYAGQIYARLEKNRYGMRQAEAVFTFIPSTGEIKQQLPTAQSIDEYQKKQDSSAEPQKEPEQDLWGTGSNTEDNTPF